MKTPLRQPYSFPGRYTVTDEPYQIDWSALMEPGESVIDAAVDVTRGDTVADRVSTAANVTTFWLSGGSSAQQVQQIRVSCTTDRGETDAILVSLTVLA